MSDELQVVDTPLAETPKSIDDLKPKMKLTGTVERLELYGAFIDIGIGVNALIHISQLGADRVNRITDVLKIGDKVSVWVDKVQPQTQQVMVTMIEPMAVDWNDLKVGQTYTGKVTRLENFGAFLDIGAEREGLVHISELSHDYVKHPGEVLKVGDEVQVQVLGFSKRKRRIDLSMKALLDKPEPSQEEVVAAPSKSRRGQKVEEVVDYEADEEEGMPTAMELALRQALGDSTIDQLTSSTRRHKRGGRKSRRQREKLQAQQEDLLNRTLQLQE